MLVGLRLQVSGVARYRYKRLVSKINFSLYRTKTILGIRTVYIYIYIYSMIESKTE